MKFIGYNFIQSSNYKLLPKYKPIGQSFFQNNEIIKKFLIYKNNNKSILQIGNRPHFIETFIYNHYKIIDFIIKLNFNTIFLFCFL